MGYRYSLLNALLLILFTVTACTGQLHDEPAISAAAGSVAHSGNDHPQFIQDMLVDIKQMEAYAQPSEITRYKFKGEYVYYVRPACCDQFSQLYSADGELLGAPDGGLTGRGDGKLIDFMEERTDAYGIWKKGK